jgi:PleD family two-component response regulator
MMSTLEKVVVECARNMRSILTTTGPLTNEKTAEINKCFKTCMRQIERKCLQIVYDNARWDDGLILPVTKRAERKQTILAVDDSAYTLSALERVLIEHYNILKAHSGETAIKMARDYLPDLILLDILMSGMTGIDACKKLKSEPETKDIPIIFTSSLAEPQYQEHGFQVGASDYITKPYSKLVLLHRIDNVLNGWHGVARGER